MQRDFRQEIEKMLVSLLKMADEQTYNRISRNCVFILSEIVNEESVQRGPLQIETKKNDRKVPISLNESLSILGSIDEQLYDVNLEIFRSSKKRTIINIRYYLKASLEEEFRNTINDCPPMLHGKIAQPPWREINDQTKFNINWPRQILRYKLRIYLARLKWRFRH